MLPITYENQCQACHPLSLDQITVPHRWQPREVHAFLENSFTAQLARGQAGLLEKKLVRPLPGKLPELLTPTVRAAIDKKVEFAEKDLYLSNRLCAECHYFEGEERCRGMIKPDGTPGAAGCAAEGADDLAAARPVQSQIASRGPVRRLPRRGGNVRSAHRRLDPRPRPLREMPRSGDEPGDGGRSLQLH